MRYIYKILIILWSNYALASQVLVVVDGKAITSVDVEKRIEALQLANPAIVSDDHMRRHILNNLISEELFHDEAKRLKVKVSEEEVKQQFAEVAKDNKITDNMLDTLMKNSSLYKQVESQVLWNKLVSLVLYNKVKVSNSEIREEQKVRKGEVREVVFKQIVFDSFDTQKVEKLQIEAQSCEHLDKLAIDNGFNKPSKNTILLAELNPQLQDIIKVIPENRLSEVINIGQHKQVIMVCSKNILNNPQDVQQIRYELTNRKINAEAQKYLAELKKRVYIEYMSGS